MEIKLEFKKTLKGLAGFEFGEKTYKEQVKDRQCDKIIFPDHIEMIASSFIQGFFSSLIEKKGEKYIKDNIKIDARNKQLVERIYDNIY